VDAPRQLGPVGRLVREQELGLEPPGGPQVGPGVGVPGHDLVQGPLQLPGALVDEPVQVLGAAAQHQAGGQDAHGPPVLDHRQVPHPVPVHEGHGSLPAGVRADGVRVRGHPVGHRGVAPPGVGVGHAAEQVALGEDAGQLARRVGHQYGPDAEPVHLAHDGPEGARERHPDGVGLHDLSDRERGLRHFEPWIVKAGCTN
jgi:hypothetical protein